MLNFCCLATVAKIADKGCLSLVDISKNIGISKKKIYLQPFITFSVLIFSNISRSLPVGKI